MKFDDVDRRMRVFETAHDLDVLPGIHIVARLDGRGFTRLTKEVHRFEAPFDERFRDLMVRTTEHLMGVGFRIVYGFTESDEISLLFHVADDGFGRRVRKINSILAGEASAHFSLRLGAHASFDCRVSQLPRVGDVVDYFRWRQEDAHRNALNGHCYWQLRREGVGAREATARLSGLSVADKNELLFRRGVNYNELPAWQKRGVGLRWGTFERTGQDPRTGEVRVADRRRTEVDLELPRGDGYRDYLLSILEGEGD